MLINNHLKNIETVEKKSNDSFESIMLLAKENAPSFYVRFNETYPELQSRLLLINADLHLTELTLCAYIYLDFQTKEIACWTYKSIKTIQNRKNSLRKKLNIPSSDDLYVWMKKRAQ